MAANFVKPLYYTAGYNKQLSPTADDVALRTLKLNVGASGEGGLTFVDVDNSNTEALVAFAQKVSTYQLACLQPKNQYDLILGFNASLSAASGQGSSIEINGQSSSDDNGGNISVAAGAGDINGGNVSITAGAGTTANGGVAIGANSNPSPVAGEIVAGADALSLLAGGGGAGAYIGGASAASFFSNVNTAPGGATDAGLAIYGDSHGSKANKAELIGKEGVYLITNGAAITVQNSGGSAVKITNLADPTDPTDGVNLKYVQGLLAGLDIKPSVLVATDGTLAGVYADGPDAGDPGVGATITASANGALVTGGNTVSSTTDRVLVKNGCTTDSGVNSFANGIYKLKTAGNGSTPWVLERATDMDQSAEIQGAFAFIEQGDYEGEGWVALSSAHPPTVGTDPITWTKFSATTAAATADNTAPALAVDSATALVIGSPVYLNSSGECELADASAAASAEMFGLAFEAGTGGTRKIAVSGVVSTAAGARDSNFTAGAPVYLSTTAGKLTPTAPTSAGDFVVRVGYAVSTTDLVVMITEPVELV